MRATSVVAARRRQHSSQAQAELLVCRISCSACLSHAALLCHLQVVLDRRTGLERGLVGAGAVGVLTALLVFGSAAKSMLG